MPSVNGTLISLHNKFFEANYYHVPLKFADEMNISALLSGGSTTKGDSYIVSKKAELEEMLKKRGVLGKLFFVESNSAHNLSYFLAQCTHDDPHLSVKDKFLIVNFDQHTDYESSRTPLQCGNWGAHICKKLKCDYLVRGVHMKNDALLYQYKEGPDKIAPKNISDFSATINGYDKLYLTVDMDVLSSPAAGSLSSGDPKSTPKRTNWQDGDVTISQLDEWLRLVPGNKIAAADITGFPPMKMLNGDRVTDSPATNAIADGYIRDILTVADVICMLMGI